MAQDAIVTKGLSKRYKLYEGRSGQLLDFLGMPVGKESQRYKEFWAIRDVTLNIAKGTTLGIIGRNGAGKSTLLRLLAGVSTATNGELVVNGRTGALLELGTGFHPDLTGHENIFACGLYLGLDRRCMESLYDDIVSFAELGPFLHQPVRTYSAGMHMRLAFSVATAQAADIQVIDEVLGVGDAYFFGKCLQRFRKFQEAGGTTILVSHDHAALLRVCNRCVWVEQGKVVADGPPLEIVSAYTQAVYEEQDRLRRPEPSVSGHDLTVAHALRTSKAVRIDDVQFLGGDRRTKGRFEMGDSLVLRVAYSSLVILEDAVVSVVVSRADGLIVCNAISAMDGAGLMIPDGHGSIELIFNPLNIGPGEYMVSVGIYPSLDLRDSTSLQHAVIWHRPVTFNICAPAGIAVDLGVCRQSVQWQVARRN
ncbi:ABC transporter ATP-binding protein [Nitrospira sp. Nam80]